MASSFIKISIGLLATCMGVARIFNLKDYKFIVVPIGLLMCNFTLFVADDMMQLSRLTAEIYPYYIFPFQVILPIIVLIAAEIKKRRRPNNILRSK